MDVSVRFVSAKPSAQNVIDIFEGEWSSKMPADVAAVATPGLSELFTDGRINWANSVIGPFKKMHVLELGALEGAHSAMLEWLGAASVTSIEGNARAFLKCLCVKEVLGLTKVRFELGNFIPYLEDCQPFDAIICSGVLYHMTDPLKLLKLITEKTDRVLIWTHYYDAAVASKRDDRDLFAEPESLNGTAFRGAKRLYPEAALSWKGFSGGADSYAIWMERQSILDFLERAGFSTSMEFDHPDHPNGPAFAVCGKLA